MKVLLFIFLCSFGKSYAQTNDYIDSYFKLTTRAKYKLYTKDIDSAIFLMEKAFKNAPYTYAYDNVVYAKCLYQKGDINNSLKFLNIGVQKGFLLTFVDSTNFPDLFSNADTRRQLSESEKKYWDARKSSFRENTDSCMYYMFNEIWYNPYNSEDEKMIASTTRAAKYIDSNLKTHEKLEERFLNFILNHGWMNERRAGISGALTICAAHLSANTLRILVPFMYEELKKGFITPDEYGFIAEKLFMFEERDGFHCHYYAAGYECSDVDWRFIIANRDQIGMSTYLNGDDYVPDGWMKRKPLYQ